MLLDQHQRFDDMDWYVLSSPLVGVLVVKRLAHYYIRRMYHNFTAPSAVQSLQEANGFSRRRRLSTESLAQGLRCDHACVTIHEQGWIE